ncbi:RNA-guided endonuclease InsQ/TnpB family protein [Nonomuraea typhae]|uniref:RNA-guided endonuclease InsQ/TnpB family protein n=1 Tax=Nonomuraea typhae TaxID=2603600 RepID=A0ABW7YTH2_9ACTN
MIVVRTAHKQTDAALTEWKKTADLAFLSEVSSVPLQQTLRHQHAAFANFFAGRAHYPRYKTRNGRQSAHYTRSAFRVRDGELHLAKTCAPLKVAWSFDADLAALNPTMVIVSREADNRWYVTLCVEAGDPEPMPPTAREAGVDLGVKDFAVLSTGEKVANPRHLERKARNLARYQRRLARRQRGSANRRKARAKVARAHRKVRDARADFLHRTTTALVRDHDMIVIEDLNVDGMTRSAAGTMQAPGRDVRQKAGLNRSVRDAAFGELRRTRHDRDHNAAKNILAAGRAVARHAGDACGADVSRQGPSLPRSAVKQETPPVRAGIPSSSRGRSQHGIPT